MNHPEPQPDSDSNEVYFDSEALDSSEQQFSASLETVGERPGFVLDSAEDSVAATDGPSALPLAAPGRVEQRVGDESLQNKDADQFSGGSSHAAQTESDWRDVVNAKVKHYKTLKPRKEHYPSLQLQFDSGSSWKFDEAP